MKNTPKNKSKKLFNTMMPKPVAPVANPDDEFLTPREVIIEEAQAYQGLENIRFKQDWFCCNACNLNWPAQYAVGLDTSKLRCPSCGKQDSRIVT
jgi:hypothetical protein